MAPVIAVVFILAVLAFIVGLTIRKVLYAPIVRQTPELPPPSEPAPQFAPSEPILVPVTESAVAPPTPPVTDPSRIPADSASVTAEKVGTVALTGAALIVPAIGVPLLAHAVSRAMQHGQYGGMDSGFARIPGAEERRNQEPPKLDVTITAAGIILVDGQAVDLESLTQRFTQLKTQRGVVRYYAEPAEPEPPQCAQVLDCILKTGVPMKILGQPAATADKIRLTSNERIKAATDAMFARIVKPTLEKPASPECSDVVRLTGIIAGLVFYWPDDSGQRIEKLQEGAHAWSTARMEELIEGLSIMKIPVERTKIMMEEPEAPSDAMMNSIGPWEGISREFGLNQEEAAHAATLICGQSIRWLKDGVDPHVLCARSFRGIMEGTRLAQLKWVELLRPARDAEPKPLNITGPVLKVSLFASGKIAIEGVEASLEEVRSRLADLKANDGIVFYYRESGEQEPPAVAFEIMECVVANSLPIVLFSKPDFSECIGPDGSKQDFRPQDQRQ